MQFIKFISIFLWILHSTMSFAQSGSIKGVVTSENLPVAYAKVMIKGKNFGAVSNLDGHYLIENVTPGKYDLMVMAVEMEPISRRVVVKENEVLTINFEMLEVVNEIQEVVVSGTMKEVSKSESPVPIEVYSAKFFKSNPTPTLFDAIQNINGVRPQINCNVCNTGDIHINGLEGPYTMILIDGMPIVSGLSSVYGLSGIPQSLIDRIEVVKGPASTLYGSEAVGGLINVITKRTKDAPLFSAEVFGTTWAEMNADLSGKFNLGKKAESILGVNYYNYSLPIDQNGDNFTDLTLQHRISLFNKWDFLRKDHRLFSLAGRYVYEDRWGGDMRWNSTFRGGDSIYGESIYTSRWELFGTYQLPLKEKILFQFSANGHDQNSVYGNISYIAQQYIGFGQLTWHKQLKRNDLLLGATFRYTYYDDNTPATSMFDTLGLGNNRPSNTYLPGIFVQDEISLNENNKLLLGIRYDYNSLHGSILTPRLNYKWSSTNKRNILRVGFGNGYRVANVFTEDHAALTGSRELVFLSDLKPEKSWNGNINFVKRMRIKEKVFFGIDASIFYTYFTNKIVADYDTDPNKIIYDNLSGYAISQGASLNLDLSFDFGLKLIAGGTFMDVYQVENNTKNQQMFAEKFTGVWTVSYEIKKWNLSFDYTGNLYSPMRLPLLSASDPRREFSPWFSIQNIQVTKKFKKGWELFGGVKNLLNWTPNRGNPFIIARANDPFDENVQFDGNGQAIATTDNPYGLTFDPTYVYGSNQGIRGFVGVRYAFK